MSVVANRKILTICIFLMIGTCLGACGTFPFKPAEEVLQSRVQGLMDAKMKHEWGKVYEFYAPSYKEEMSRDAFLGINRKSDLVRYEIVSIEISPSGDEATVKLKTDMAAMSFEFPGVVLTQKWIKEGWTWYLQVHSESKETL